MENKELNKLQQYIGHCSNLDEQIKQIEAVNSVSPLTVEEWYKLYFPACGNCDVTLFKWLQKSGANINYDAASLLKWTVSRQQYVQETIMKQVEITKLIIEELAENKAQIMGQALLTACGFNCIDCAFLLIKSGADISVVNEKGLSPLDMAHIYGERFSDFTLYLSLLPLFENDSPLKEAPKVNSVGLCGYFFSSGKCHCITIHTYKKQPILFNAKTNNEVLQQLIKDLKHCFVPLNHGNKLDCFSVMPDKIQFIIASPAHLPEHDWLEENELNLKKIVTTLKTNVTQIIKPYLLGDVQKVWAVGFADKVLYTEKEYIECVNVLKSSVVTINKTSCFVVW
ncbi:ankyrin repeat domain-containing protein [Bacteroides fragilis]